MCHMKLISLLLTLMLLSACKNKKQTGIGSQLAGMYKLYIIETQDSTGVWKQQQWAKDGEGYIVYDGKGHMAVQITPKGYKDFPWISEEGTINDDTLKQKIESMAVADLKAAVT